MKLASVTGTQAGHVGDQLVCCEAQQVIIER